MKQGKLPYGVSVDNHRPNIVTLYTIDDVRAANIMNIKFCKNLSKAYTLVGKIEYSYSSKEINKAWKEINDGCRK